MSSTELWSEVQLAHLPPEYLAENQGRSLLLVSIAFFVVETVFFGMFMASRVMLLKNYSGVETWLFMPLGYMLCVSSCALGICFVKMGIGRHIAYFLLTNPRTIFTGFKLLAIQEFLYGAAITFPKVTIATLYLRVLREQWARRITYLVCVIVVLNEMSMIIGSSLICQPFAFKWDKSIAGGHCGDIMALYRYVSIPNIITDVAILILPFPTLYKLQISTPKKAGIFLTFLTGGFGIVTSTVRFARFYTTDLLADPTYLGVDTQTWTIIEPGAYFLCACLPGIQPVLRLIYENIAQPKFINVLHQCCRRRGGASSEFLNDKDDLWLSGTHSMHSAQASSQNASSSVNIETPGAAWSEENNCFELHISNNEVGTRFLKV